jgi:hypothetical protein
MPRLVRRAWKVKKLVRGSSWRGLRKKAKPRVRSSSPRDRAECCCLRGLSRRSVQRRAERGGKDNGANAATSCPRGGVSPPPLASCHHPETVTTLNHGAHQSRSGGEGMLDMSWYTSLIYYLKCYTSFYISVSISCAQIQHIVCIVQDECLLVRSPDHDLGVVGQVYVDGPSSIHPMQG